MAQRRPRLFSDDGAEAWKATFLPVTPAEQSARLQVCSVDPAVNIHEHAGLTLRPLVRGRPLPRDTRKASMPAAPKRWSIKGPWANV